MRIRLYHLGSLLVASSVTLGAAGDNIALGKKCELDPRPSYPFCTDPNDEVQVTDGIHSEGYFWTQLTTVGWTNASRVVITVDLETDQGIRGASYSTAGGGAGVTWPTAVTILVSPNGKEWYPVGDLVRIGAEAGSFPPRDGYGLHRFQTETLRTHGRYVAFLVMPGGPYTFVDEVEIYRGDDDFLGVPYEGRPIEGVDSYFKSTRIPIHVRSRLRADAAAVRASLEGLPHASRFLEELDTVTEQIGTFEGDHTTALPMGNLHQRIFDIQAATWRERNLAPIVVWQKNRWDMLSPTEPPRGGGAEVEVKMMRNEFRGAAFNLSNSGTSAAELSLAITGLPGGPNPSYITVHEVPFTDTKSGVAVAAALPLARKMGNAYRVDIPSGLTRQIWLTFNPKNVEPGLHHGRIRIEPDGLSVPVTLKLYPMVFPDHPTLHLGGWDYTDVDAYDVTEKNRAALIRNLREHFVDTPWAHPSTMSSGSYDSAGEMIQEPDSTNFERWVSRWPDSRTYAAYNAMGPRFAGLEQGTPAFKKAVSSWITWWVEKARELGIEPGQLILLLLDENNALDEDQTMVEYARVINATEPDVVVWQNPTWRKPWEALPEMFAEADVLCPNLPMLIQQGKKFADFYVRQREVGKELWFYSCSGPGKLLDPYAYHRMQAWFAWKYGAEGIVYWAFGDSNGASSWNEYESKIGAYTPLFLTPDSVTSGKHMEAIREGVEDFEYLRMLSTRLAEVEKTGRKRKGRKARELLAKAAARVTACMTEAKQIRWKYDKDRSVADVVRIEVLEALEKLDAP